MYDVWWFIWRYGIYDDSTILYIWWCPTLLYMWSSLLLCERLFLFGMRERYIHTYIQTCRKTNLQANRQTDKQTYTHANIPMHSSILICAHKQIHTHAHAHTHTHTHTHAHTRASARANTHTHTHTNTQKHTITQTHTHTHMQISALFESSAVSRPW